MSAYADWLASYGLGTYVTLTYRDDYWYKVRRWSTGSRVSTRAVLSDVRTFFRAAGYSGRYFVCVENTDRAIPHIHGVMDGGITRSNLWLLWHRSRGAARVLPVTDGCESYVSKYVLKDSRGDGIDFRLESRETA